MPNSANTRPVHIVVQQAAWMRFNNWRKNPRYRNALKRILVRDDFTCFFCNFRSTRFQQVVNKEGDYTSREPKNLVTACPYCAQCHFIDGFDMDELFSGEVIYLPEIPQAELSNLCRVIFHTLSKQSSYRNHMQALYLSLKDRKETVEKIFGPGTSNPAIFAQSLLDCGVPLKQLQTKHLEPLRILPVRKDFMEQTQHYAKETLNRFPI